VFTGFSREMLAFFAAIRFNNNREFFEENRQIYEQAVRNPLMALAETLAPTVLAIDPQLDARPGRSVSRIHRDVRFSKDKSPYRDYMWVGFRQTGESREDTCGFYFDISDTAVHWGCGYYHMQPEYLKNLRQLILDKPTYVQGILDEPAFAGTYQVCGERYVRQYAPPEHLSEALGALYQKKSVYIEHTLEDMEELFSPALADHVAADFRMAEPFYTLMRKCAVKRIEEARV